MNFSREYNRAITYQKYLEKLGNSLNLHNLHYNKFVMIKEIAEKIAKFRNVDILVITEPWCGDSLALLPILRKIAEVQGHWEIKIILRDEHPGLIDQFLTKGVRGIPMFLFLDEKGTLLFKWGPRPKKATQIYENHREQIWKGQIEKQKVIKKIRTYYAKDRGINTLSELIQIFEEFGL